MHGQNKRTVNYGKYLNVHVNARNSSTLILTEMYIYIHRLTGRKHYTVTLILGLGSKGISICKKGKGSPYSITERRVPELIPVLGSQPAGDVSHKPGGRLPQLPSQPLKELLPISLLGEQSHDGCKQFA